MVAGGNREEDEDPGEQLHSFDERNLLLVAHKVL